MVSALLQMGIRGWVCALGEYLFICVLLYCREAYHVRKGKEKKKGKEESKKTVKTSADTPSRVLTKGAVFHFKGAELSASREDIKVCGEVSCAKAIEISAAIEYSATLKLRKAFL